MHKTNILLLLIVLASFITASGQNIKKSLRKGDDLMEQGQFRAAIEFYQEVLGVDPNHPEANYKIGKAYLNTIQKTKSLPYLEKALTTYASIAPDVKYLLARSYHYNHKLEEAKKYYTLYLNEVDKKNTELVKKVQKKIEECEYGIEYMKNPVKAKIENLGPVVNSKRSDFAPVITADESILVFTSRRPGSTGGLLDEKNEFYEDIYISYRKNGVWTEPKNIGKPINTDYHDASIAISPDGSQIFVYKDQNNGDILMSKFEQGKWSKPIDLGKNVNTKYAETSVSMTADGKTIYFTSNREGGLGGFDIYMSKMDKKGKWGEAVNLGPTINTPFEEEAPFIHPDGRTLYFSSTGHSGMGGYDIFKSTMKSDGSWSEPENIGYPINTADDDIYFVLSADNKHGYYASEREGGVGEKDLYIISMPEPEKLAEVTSKETTLLKTETTKKKIAPIAKVESFNPITILKGTVKDAITKDPIEANLLIIDNQKNELISEIKSNSETGAFLIILPSGKNYGISIEKADYLFHSENFDIPASTNYQEVYKEIELKKVAIGSKIILKNIFYDFAKATLRPESTAELDRLYQLLVDLPNLKIEISGHTDNKGSAELNKELSLARAKSVVDYLVKKGIKESRLKYAGYGFDRPIATNETEEGRQLNRRTEFEIIGN
ncbi:MAG TPA: OmpA family protein [Cytophagaceae bacterium]